MDAPTSVFYRLPPHRRDPRGGFVQTVPEPKFRYSTVFKERHVRHCQVLPLVLPDAPAGRVRRHSLQVRAQAAWSHLRSPWLRERLPIHRQRRSNRLRLDRKYTLSTEICALGADKRPTRRKPTMWGPTVVYIYKADLRPTCPMGDVWGGGADKWPTKGRRQKL